MVKTNDQEKKKWHLNLLDAWSTGQREASIRPRWSKKYHVKHRIQPATFQANMLLLTPATTRIVHVQHDSLRLKHLKKRPVIIYLTC